jgi:hypothetical protein
MDRNRLLDCPTCALPAEVVDRFVLDGSPHPVEHVKLRCITGHWFTFPTDTLGASERSDGGHAMARRPAQVGRGDRRPGSRFRRALTYLKGFWEECDHAQRRLLEIQLGVPMR